MRECKQYMTSNAHIQIIHYCSMLEYRIYIVDNQCSICLLQYKNSELRTQKFIQHKTQRLSINTS